MILFIETTDTQEVSSTAITARNVELTYSDGTRAVRGIDLETPKDEFFGFLGSNGAGKTTAIKTFVTLLRPTARSETVNGFDVVGKAGAVRSSIGYMAQETSVDEELLAGFLEEEARALAAMLGRMQENLRGAGRVGDWTARDRARDCLPPGKGDKQWN